MQVIIENKINNTYHLNKAQIRQSIRIINAQSANGYENEPICVPNCINMWPLFSQQSQMKRISNTRQKLVLNRTNKTSTSPKIQQSKLSQLRLTTLHSSFAIHQSISKKPLKSSIFGKENEGALLLRCRSISCVEKERIQNKPIPILNKFYSNSRKQDKNLPVRPQVDLATLDFVLSLKQRGFFSNKSNLYSIPSATLTEIIMEFAEKMRQQYERLPIINSDDTFSSKHESSLHVASKIQSFAIQKQFSITVSGSFKILSYQSALVNLQIEGQILEQRKCFQQAIDALRVQSNQQALTFIYGKLKYLQQEIKNRSNSIDQLNHQIEALNIKKKQHQLALIEVESHIASQHNVLIDIEKQRQEMEGFVYRQPNKILQKQAQGYKQRQQELFDLAFIMDQSSIQSVQTYVAENIQIPSESFKITLSTFMSHEPDDDGNYLISSAAIKAFKSSISAVYDSTVCKLKSIIEAKFNKIKDFVRIMRRLASYTIGKRENLTEINKKMASASHNIEGHIKSLRKAFSSHSEMIDELQKLFECMKNIYCEAEVFY